MAIPDDLENNDIEKKTGRDLSLPKIKSLSELMGAYKMTVAWQSSFYDHFIRDEKSYENFSHYILNNPNSWDQDKFFRKIGS